MKLNKIIPFSVITIIFIGCITVNAFEQKTIIQEDTVKENIPSGLKYIKYKLDGATIQNWTEYTNSFTISNKGITFITVKTEDLAGNIFQKMSVAQIIDEEQKEYSGLKKVEYKLEGATTLDWTDYNTPFTINSNGITLVSVRAIDNANNIGEITSTIQVGDKLYSGLKKVEYKLEGSTIQNWTDYITPFTVNNKGITFILAKATDNAGNIGQITSMIKIGDDSYGSISGIKKVEYKLSGAIETKWTDYTKPLNLTGEGMLFIMARAIDNAGNVANGTSYVQPIVLGKSGINKIVYKLEGATNTNDWITYDNVFTINNNGITSILARAYDKAGNVAYETSVAKIGFPDRSNIDRVEYKLSGATTKDWTKYNGAFYISSEGVTTITARAYDKAGNVSQEVTGQVKIDKSSAINSSIKIELLD